MLFGINRDGLAYGENLQLHGRPELYDLYLESRYY